MANTENFDAGLTVSLQKINIINSNTHKAEFLKFHSKHKHVGVKI